MQFWCIDSWGLSPLWALCYFESRCMKLIFNPRSFPLNPDVNYQTLRQVGHVEVIFKFGGCSRSWTAATKLFPVASFPTIWCLLRWHLFVNPFSASCWKSAILCFCNILGFLLSMFLTLNLLSDLYRSVDSQVLSCIGVFRCTLPLWSVHTFHLGMLGETNSGTLSTSRLGQSIVIHRIRSLSSFCSVQP